MKKITSFLILVLFTSVLFSQEVALTDFVLVNSDTNEDLMVISEGTQINLYEYPGIQFNIRANGTAAAKSVRFQLSGALVKTATESAAPYALYGDFPTGSYYGQDFPVGDYTLSAVPYSLPSAGGSAGNTVELNFEVIATPLSRPFITTWSTYNPSDPGDNRITIPTYLGENYNYTVDWGDGTSESGITGDVTHTYDTPGSYQISISGDFPRIYLKDRSSDFGLFEAVEQWGTIKWSSMESAFDGYGVIDIRADDSPDLGLVKSMKRMFAQVDITVNENINSWDVGAVNDMSELFSDSNFNQVLSSWNVGNATKMVGMFNESAFNQDIGAWNVAKVTDMAYMFRLTPFDIDISGWDVSTVKNMDLMFMGGVFNQDINGWDVHNVQNMSGMFSGNESFDQNVGSWDISKVLSMGEIFDGALSTENYDAILNGWATRSSLQKYVRFGAGDTPYCRSRDARQKLINEFGWRLTDGGKEKDCGVTQRPFVTTWKTSDQGLYLANEITIPVFYDENYDYTVDWGDGTSESGIKSDARHVYETPGTYDVSISGDFPRIHFNYSMWENQASSSNLLFVKSWGTIKWSSMEDAFAGCNNLDVLATDIPNLSSVKSTTGMFSGCTSLMGNDSFKEWDLSEVERMELMFYNAPSFNQYIGDWDVANVTNMRMMFYEATSFNQDIGNWDVANVTDMEKMFAETSFNQNIENWDVSNVEEMNGMFFKSGFSTNNYDRILNAWVNLSNLTTSVKLGAENIFYCKGEEARQKLIEDFSWIITDGGKAEDCDVPQKPFITTWKTDSPGISEDNRITIPTFPGESYNYTVNWGDGTSESGITGDVTHTYDTPGSYQISISGDFPRIYLKDRSSDFGLFEAVEQWGTIKWSSMESAFDGYGVIDIRADDSPDLGLVKSMKRMFAQVDITVNENINSWDVGAVNDMSELFFDSNFNQVIADWNVQNVQDMGGMFAMTPFNKALSGWDVGKVTKMDRMFMGSPFNQDIAAWNVAKVTDMSQMFRSSSFDIDISGWVVSAVQNMDRMFRAAVFDQNISQWNVASVQTMIEMFKGNESFNQNLGGWNIAKVGSMDFMFDGSLSAENYDAILNGWAGRTSLQNNVELTVGDTPYCQGEEARQKLIEDFGWIITDGGKSDTCSEVEVAADLVAATFLQGGSNPSPTGSILRAEDGNREVYLKFDLSALNGPITEAQLQMQVASDPGYGTLEVFLGSDSNWTENGLNGSNKPSTIGNAIGTISGTHTLGQTKIWDLTVDALSGGGLVTFIIKHSNGNDVAFASDETFKAPKLLLTTGVTGPMDVDGDGYFSDVDCNDNDPAIHPDALEVCDGIDNNCDGLIDDEDATVTCDSVGAQADLIEATYLQGLATQHPKDPF